MFANDILKNNQTFAVIGVSPDPEKYSYRIFKRLLENGYQSYANTTKAVKQDDNWCTPLPHKTVATRTGLGWIGKNCLLVTKEYGSAVRLSSLLTDAPLPAGTPDDIRKSAESITGKFL